MKGPIIRSEAGSFSHLEDPDGNEIYLWEVNGLIVAEAELAHADTM
jgi:hypothetical protein